MKPCSTCRFTQEDALKDGGNWYAYCGNDPLNYVDEDGQVFFLATAAIGAAIGGLVGGVTAGVREYKDAKASGLSGKDLAKQVAASAGKSALAGAAVGGAIGLGAGALAAVATAGTAATTAAVTATTAGKAAATVALATTTSTSWQQGEKIGQGQKLTAGSVVNDTAQNTVVAIAYTIPETRVVVGTLNAVKSGSEAIAAAKSGNAKQAVVSGASAVLNVAAAASGVKEIAPKVSGYFPKAQCPGAEKAASDKIDFYVTQDGVVFRNGIPDNYVENPYRSGSYGLFDENGKFSEKLRIDPATPTGKKGPEYSHYHLDGGKEHFSPRTTDNNPLDF